MYKIAYMYVIECHIYSPYLNSVCAISNLNPDFKKK